MRYYVLILLLIRFFSSDAQNKTTSDGLKTGMWITHHETDSQKTSAKGCFKIIPVDTYQILDSFEGGLHVKTGRTARILFYETKFSNLISVRDSIWEEYDATGSLTGISNWQNGLLIWTKSYDKNGILTYFSFDAPDTDSNLTLTYADNRIFRSAYYPSWNKNTEIIKYYPENNLKISNAELRFIGLFSDPVTGDNYVYLSSEKTLQITHIYSLNGLLSVQSEKKLPCSIIPENEVMLKITPTADPFTFQPFDTIMIITSEPDSHYYKLYCQLQISHINGSNVEKIQHLSLSKTKDRYLLIAPMGTQTDAFIDTKNGTCSFRINGITKIDLAGFEPGEYPVSIGSCNTFGDITLNITE